MKLSLRRIVMLVILALTCIFGYQVYWLTSLYRSWRTEALTRINEALSRSDFKELMARVEKYRNSVEHHGLINISSGSRKDSTHIHVDAMKNVGLAREVQFVDKNVVFVRADTTVMKDTVVNGKTMKIRYVNSNQMHLKGNGIDSLMGSRMPMEELAEYYQKGLHLGLDAFGPVDIKTYDSLLTLELRQAGLEVPHQTELIYAGPPDTIMASVRTPGYMPTKDALAFSFIFDLNGRGTYHVKLEPIDTLIIQQMTGILTASVLILILISAVFIYLLYVVRKQKTLDEMKSDFTNNMTHELKTPIAVAYAAGDALLNFDAMNDRHKLREYLQISQQQLRKLSQLVEQILSVSMERRGRIKLQIETFGVRDVLIPIVEQHRLKTHAEADISLSVEPEDLCVRADKMHFQNIVGNLVDNALKYGGTSVAVSIRCRKEERSTTVSVTYSGPGIPQAKQRYVFDKFYRLPDGNQHNVKGYGLGLYYVRSLMTSMGGRVTLESEPGKGSTFKLQFYESD